MAKFDCPTSALAVVLEALEAVDSLAAASSSLCDFSGEPSLL